MFTNIYEPRDIMRVIEKMKDVGRRIGRTGGMKSVVIGMPNTGKSSMLNVIRRHATDRKCSSINVWLMAGKAVKTSSQAGLTRSISNVIKVVDDPLIYMSDSPGTYIPRKQLTQAL
jgi:ribosome biogenesis GTPase A